MTKTAEAVELTPRQSRFVDEYLVDLNATQAAIRAGYSKKTAYAQGQRLLKKAEIAKAIERANEERSERTGVTAAEVINQLARMGFSDVRKLFTPGGQLRSIHDLDDDTAAAIQSIEVVTKYLPTPDGEEPEIEYVHKVKLADKKGPLELIGKHLAMWTERHDHTSSDGSMSPQGKSLDDFYADVPAKPEP